MSTDAERRSAASRKGWRSRRAMQIARMISNGGPAGEGLTEPERTTEALGEPAPAGANA